MLVNGFIASRRWEIGNITSIEACALGTFLEDRLIEVVMLLITKNSMSRLQNFNLVVCEYSPNFPQQAPRLYSNIYFKNKINPLYFV